MVRPPYTARYMVRTAQPADAERLGQVHVQAWREAYAGIMPADLLAGLDPVARAEGWRRRLLAPANLMVVGMVNGDVVGFASSGRSRDDPPEPPGEVYSLYLLAAHHGSGLGTLLLEAVLEPLLSAGASLWVATENARARAFYARNGFRPDGRSQTYGPAAVPEVRLVRAPFQPRDGAAAGEAIGSGE